MALDFPIECPSRVEPVDAASREGEEVVRRTATLLLHGVARKLFPNARLHVGQSLRGGYHYGVSGEHPPLTELAAALDEALPPRGRRGAAGRPAGSLDRRRPPPLRAGRGDPQGPPPARLAVAPGPARLLPRLHRRAARPLRPLGPLLPELPRRAVRAGAPPRLRRPGRGAAPRSGRRGRVLFNAYTETKRWNELIGVGTVPDLNDLCLGDRIKHVIRIAEGQQEKKIAELADRIAARRDELRVVCIAGPSSSGKTTFVKRLSIQLEVNGITPRTLSLDDYYVDREKTPLDADGDFDFEALEAIDLPLFLPHLKAARRRPARS